MVYWVALGAPNAVGPMLPHLGHRSDRPDARVHLMVASTHSPFFDPALTPSQCALFLYELFLFAQCNGTEHATRLPGVSRDYEHFAELTTDGKLFPYAEDLKREAVRSGIPLETEILAEMSFASLTLGEPLPLPTRDRLNRLTGVLWAWIVRLDGLAARTFAAGVSEAPPTEPKQTTKKPKISRKDALILVRDHLLKHAKGDPEAITARDVAQATGVSLGMLPRLPPWIVFEQRRKELRQETGTPRTVSLTAALLASIPDRSDDPVAEAIRNEELQALIEEQEDDQAKDDRDAAFWTKQKRKRSRQPPDQ